MPNKTTKKGNVEKSVMIPAGMMATLKPILRRRRITFSALVREALTVLLTAYDVSDSDK